MVRLIAMYKTPVDKAAFDRYYFGKHIPLAKTIPGLRRYEVMRAPIGSLDGTAPWYLIALLEFDSLTAVDAALASDAGRATAADLENFAQAGVEIYFAESSLV
jgi:uncharacterized protein (TIGR02118 family)